MTQESADWERNFFRTDRLRLVRLSYTQGWVGGAELPKASRVPARPGKADADLLRAHSAGATTAHAPAPQVCGSVVAQVVNLRRLFKGAVNHLRYSFLDFRVTRIRITARHRGDVAEWLKAAVC